MNQSSLLQELAAKLATGEVTREQILAVVQTPTATTPANTVLTRILYVFGAAIAVVGMIIFVSQVWTDLGSIGRVVVTLGLGVTLAIAGSILYVQKPENPIGTIFHSMGGLLIPGGAMVALSEMSVDQHSLWPVFFTFVIITAFYIPLCLVHRRIVLTIFSIANTTTCAYLLVAALLEESTYQLDHIYAWLTMAIGLGYLLMAHSFRQTWNKLLAWVLAFFGSVAFLGAAFSQVWDSVVWQVAFCFLIIAGLYASAHFKSRTILAVSTGFLIAHVSFITSEYFSDSLGWPISLVLLGFALIGLGYGSFVINRNYIAKK